MEEFVRKGILFSLYGGLLNENQRQVYEYHIIEDMSFTEIGELVGISRQAAQDLFRRADRKLQQSENTLRLQQKFTRLRSLAERIQSESGEAWIRALAGEMIDGI